MPAPVNRAQLRKETHRSGFTGNVPVDEAASVVLRRNGEGDYRLAIDDKALTDLITEESNQTQTAINTVNTSVQAVHTRQSDGSQLTKLAGATGTQIASTASSLNVNVTNPVSTVSINTTQYNNLVSLLTRIAVATEATQANTASGA